MKNYSINIRTKNNDTFLDVINRLSNLDCELFLSKQDIVKPYVYNYAEVEYHKLGEKRGRTVDEYKKDVELYNFISGILNAYGLLEKHLGYRYIVECVRIMIVYGVEKYTLDKDVYPIIANWYGVSITSIEHNVRNCIQTAWEHNNEIKGKKNKNRMAVFDKKPTNLRFLRHVSDQAIYSFTNA